MSLPPIGELNRMSGPAFRDALRPLFEAAEPLAATLEHDRPYASYTLLLDQAESVLARLPESDQAQVLNAHPRIGARVMSALSAREQGPPEPELEAELARLNDAYEQRFGFRCVVFVNGRPKAAILPVLRQRLRGTRSAELATGCREMLAIARDRLSRMGT
jgi:2-oxo-4-hydroxy-4-carboxy-5-ureidoimidazoline decarboxylase